MKKKYQTGLLIGRFQPFHKGHLWLIKQALQCINTLKIAVGSANVVNNTDNFLTYDQRKKMLETVIEKENLGKKIIKIISLCDYPDDDIWFEKTIAVAGFIDVIVGNNEWVNSIFEKKGYDILETGYYKRYLYEGEKIRKLIKSGKSWQDRLPSYLISNFQFLISKQFTNFQKPVYKFSHIVLGGTFDYLHKGHKLLIDKAFELGEKVTIGLTTAKLTKNKIFSQTIENYKERKEALINYLTYKNYDGRFKIFPLNDVFGPSITDSKFEAIIVSSSTYPNALKINQVRKKNKLKSLKIVAVENIMADDGKLLSSERIRAGEIDKEGKSYQLLVNSYLEKKIKTKNHQLTTDNCRLILPEKLREELRRPLGKIIQGKQNKLDETAGRATQFINELKSVLTIAVGDIIYASLVRIGFIPDVGIIDYKSRRTPINKISIRQLADKYQILKSQMKNKKMVNNQSGTISKPAFEVVLSSIKNHIRTKNKQLIIVDGEEDLLALPAILFSPLGSLVLYGHFQYGVIGVEVTEKIKEKIVKILNKFI